jgi:hypothetical protein
VALNMYVVRYVRLASSTTPSSSGFSVALGMASSTPITCASSHGMQTAWVRKKPMQTCYAQPTHPSCIIYVGHTCGSKPRSIMRSASSSTT